MMNKRINAHGIVGEQPLKTVVKGVVDIVQFQAAVEHAQSVNQIGYVLVTYEGMRDEVLEKIRTVIRKYDIITIVKPGHILILLHHQGSEVSTDTVVKNIKRKVGENIGVVGTFMPYPQLPLEKVFKHLNELSNPIK